MQLQYRGDKGIIGAMQLQFRGDKGRVAGTGLPMHRLNNGRNCRKQGPVVRVHTRNMSADAMGVEGC